MILLTESEDLLHECEVNTFGASDPRSQHVNTESAVRLKHRPSGLVVNFREKRRRPVIKILCTARHQ
jgi:protein subunit release factor B